MSRTQQLETQIKELDRRVAELSIERITWEQRARISEQEEVRSYRELQLTKAALAVSERELRTKPIAMLVWRRIQSILRGRR